MTLWIHHDTFAQGGVGIRMPDQRPVGRSGRQAIILPKNDDIQARDCEVAVRITTFPLNMASEGETAAIH